MTLVVSGVWQRVALSSNIDKITVNLFKACHLQDKRHCVTSNTQSCHAMTYSQHIILINLLGFEHLIVIVSTFLHFN